MAAPIRPTFQFDAVRQPSANAMPVSGPLMRLLGHAAIYDVNLNYQKSFHQSAGLGIAGSSQQSVNISGGLNLPLHESGKSHSLLGQLSLGGHINAQRTTASAWVMGYDSNASWSPVDGLQFDINRNVIGSPGGSASVLSIQTDVLVFDPRTHQDVRVTQLSGSNPDLRSSSTTSTDLRATYMHRPSPQARWGSATMSPGPAIRPGPDAQRHCRKRLSRSLPARCQWPTGAGGHAPRQRPAPERQPPQPEPASVGRSQAPRARPHPATAVVQLQAP
jgi:hypothetical protein